MASLGRLRLIDWIMLRVLWIGVNGVADQKIDRIDWVVSRATWITRLAAS